MKVLHVINSLRSGGAEKLLEDLLARMNGQEGIQIEVLLLTDKGNVFDKGLREAGIPIYVVPLKSVYNPLNIFYLRRHILKNKYDIVHVHLFPAFYWISFACTALGRNKPKLVLTEHSTYNRRRKYDFFRPFERYVYSKYGRLISISSQTQSNLMQWLKVSDTTKFIVIENGISIDKFKHATPYEKSNIANGLKESDKLVIMVARFTEQKDQSTVIKAMLDLPEDIHLLLIGEGPLLDKNRSLADGLGLQNRVHFLGFRDDVPKLLKSSNVVVLSSHWEGFGLAAVEGMAAGKPVVASDIPGLREVVCGAGLLFRPGDSKDLSIKMAQLFGDQCLYDEVSKRCMEMAENYSIQKTVQGYIKVYKSLVL